MAVTHSKVSISASPAFNMQVLWKHDMVANVHASIRIGKHSYSAVSDEYGRIAIKSLPVGRAHIALKNVHGHDYNIDVVHNSARTIIVDFPKDNHVPFEARTIVIIRHQELSTSVLPNVEVLVCVDNDIIGTATTNSDPTSAVASFPLIESPTNLVTVKFTYQGVLHTFDNVDLNTEHIHIDWMDNEAPLLR